MTDEHGPESDPMHDEASHEEHAPSSAESAGTWSDDHPPVDDFSDAGSAHEEAASVSEEASEEETAPPLAQPARSMLPLFAGIGGILLIGAVIYWQFGHSAPPPMMVTQSQTPKSASSLPPASKPAAIPAPPGKVEESDITALYKAPPEPASPTMPYPSSSGPAPTTSLAMPPESAPPAMPAAVAPPVNSISPSAPPAVMPAPAPVPAAPVVEARIDTLAASVSALQKSVEATTQEVNKLNTMIAANQVMPPAAPSQMNPALENRLNKIEQNLMQIEHNETTKQAPAIVEPSEAEATSETVTRPVLHHRKPAAKQRHKPVHTKTVHHAAPPISVEPMAVSSAWVLRAATPSEAWVAPDAHTSELKHVQVGDSLPGIGTVRAIRQTAGGWEIEGTTGTIR